MEQKKPTKAQIERRLQNAVVLVEKTKDMKSVYLSDKGLRLTVTDDYAIIATGFHRHVFDKVTMQGISRPWLYTDRFIDIALENDCKTDNGYSFTQLLNVLKDKEDRTEYNIAVFVEWWLFNCFQPLFSIGESEAESFLVYESYLHNIARNAVIMSEKREDMSNKQFFNKVISNMQEFIEGVDERVIFPKKTDEERIKEEIDALQQSELEEQIKEG